MYKLIKNQEKYILIDNTKIKARPIQRKATIVISLIKESKKITDDEILKEISEAFSNEELVIPWCEKVEKITLNYG